MINPPSSHPETSEPLDGSTCNRFGGGDPVLERPTSPGILAEDDAAERHDAAESNNSVAGGNEDLTPVDEDETGAHPASPAQNSDDDASASSADAPKSSRRRLTLSIVAAVALVVVLVGTLGAWLLLRGESRQTRYLATLDEQGLTSQFANEAAALANARRVSASLEDGGPTEGYARDLVAVEIYCDDFLGDFRVVPTPEEQRSAYLGALDSEGLAGRFASDEQAVAHAENFCEGLASGAPQQGMPEDRIAVQVYCGKFLGGFKVLRTETISGSFTLLDSSPSIYYPAITSYGGVCFGSGGFSDISAGTAVIVRNDKGDLLTQTSLATGSGSPTNCKFTFNFEVTEGEGSYVVSVSKRGELSFSFADLSARGVALTLGD